jgi:hypothetical protein
MASLSNIRFTTYYILNKKDFKELVSMLNPHFKEVV